MKKGLIAALLFSSAALISADIEVVITASRIEEPAAQSPYNTIIISEEDLKDAGSLAEILSKIPGLDITSTGGSPSFSARGFGENGFGRLLILKDGEKINRPDMAAPDLNLIPLNRVERIEIVLGSPSVAYGSGAVAGVINVITKKTAPSFGGSLLYRGDWFLGNQEQAELWGGKGDISLFLSYQRNQSGAQRDRSAIENTIVSFKSVFSLGKYGNVSFSMDKGDIFSQLPGGLLRSLYDQDPNQAVNKNDQTSENFWSGRISTELNFDWVKVSLPGTLRHTDVFADYASLSSFSDVKLWSIQSSPTVSMDIPILDVMILNAKIGSDLAIDRLFIKRFPTVARTSVSTEADFDRRTLAPWTSMQVLIADQLAFQVGGRFDVTNLDANSPGTSPIDGSVFLKEFGLNGGLSWSPENFKIYTNFARFFRTPFLDEQVSYYGFGDAFYKNLVSETGVSLDLGANEKFWEISLSQNMYALFMEGEIQSVEVSPWVYENQNIGSSFHYGFGLQAQWKNSLILTNLGYDYTKALLSSGINIGKDLPLISEHVFKGSVKITAEPLFQPWAIYQISSESIKGGDSGNTQSKIPVRQSLDTGITSLLKVDTYGSFSITAQVKNLLDDRTPTTVYWSSFSGNESWYPSQGRTVEISGRWDF